MVVVAQMKLEALATRLPLPQVKARQAVRVVLGLAVAAVVVVNLVLQAQQLLRALRITAAMVALALRQA